MSFGYFGMYKSKWYCRWCSKPTNRQKSERDGFCDNNGKCKQAWWRAFHAYLARVTKAPRSRNAAGGKSNARLKPKKPLPWMPKRKTPAVLPPIKRSDHAEA